MTTRSRRLCNGAVGGPAIDHNHLANPVRTHGGDTGADRRLLVQAGNDDGDALKTNGATAAEPCHRLTSSSAGRSPRMSEAAYPIAGPLGIPGMPAHSIS